MRRGNEDDAARRAGRHHSPWRAIGRAIRLRCPACGIGPLFRGLLAMVPGCDRCGYSFGREPGFYLGSIYINYGVTAIVTILLYAAMVMGLGASHERALAVTLAVAVLLPVVFFRWARALLLVLDDSVNANQSHGDAPGADADGGSAAGLTERQLTRLKTDDGNAGCVLGVGLVLILLFGLLMAGVTLSFVTAQPAGDSSDGASGQPR